MPGGVPLAAVTAKLDGIGGTMAFYLDLFTPETWAAFRRQEGDPISGFRVRQRKTAERPRPGDIFLCYLVRLSRSCGVLQVTSNCFIDDCPVFSNPDPFVVRFKVEPLVVLDVESSIPIESEQIWPALSWTKGIPVGMHQAGFERFVG